MYHNAKRINILLAKKDKTLQRTIQQHPTVGITEYPAETHQTLYLKPFFAPSAGTP